MPEIPLTQGMVAIVDTDDFDYLNQWKWHTLNVEKLWYAARNIRHGEKHAVLLMHRLILNAPKGQEIDHRDGNGLNNCRHNLRFCTHQQNHYNLRNRVNTSSIYKGVSWQKDKCKWRATLTAGGKRKHIGYFKDELQAGLAYNWLALIEFGEFARLNILVPIK